jgi:inosose dehydratase
MIPERRIAGAPISWGVVEVPDWGYQMEPERVLREAASIGLKAMEAGPEGFLPQNPTTAAGMFAEYQMRLVGGFVPAVLHNPEVCEAELSSIERKAEFFSAAGADVLVLAASTGLESYESSVELDDDSWRVLFETLSSSEEIGTRYGLTVTLHPHYGTVIERPHHIQRFLEGCDTGMCLDTGHLAIAGGDPVEIAEQAAGRVRYVHLKDVDQNLAELVSSGSLGYEEAVGRGVFKPLGDGDVEVERLVSLLERASYGGWYVLEQDIMLESEPAEGQGPIMDVQKSLAFLK